MVDVLKTYFDSGNQTGCLKEAIECFYAIKMDKTNNNLLRTSEVEQNFILISNVDEEHKTTTKLSFPGNTTTTNTSPPTIVKNPYPEKVASSYYQQQSAMRSSIRGIPMLPV